MPRYRLHRAAARRNTKAGGADNPSLNIFPQLHKNFDYPNLLYAVLRAYISEGYVSQSVAANLMNTSVRTLTRRLAGYGLTYGGLMDDLRFKVAKERVREPEVLIGDIARSVGFKDPGDFTRMFHRIGGLNPNEYRDSIQN